MLRLRLGAVAVTGAGAWRLRELMHACCFRSPPGWRRNPKVQHACTEVY
jgi:hypothetical protein